MIGTEADACRAKLRVWIERLRTDFDPGKRGADYLHEGLLRVFDDHEERIYNTYMQCCCAFLDNIHRAMQ